MFDELINSVSEYEKQNTHPDKWRPHFHLCSTTGWISDPNGLCVFKDKIHMFYQYTPFNVAPVSTNFWGHYTTLDYINYTAHKPALCCDSKYDANGVFSGSAYINNDVMNIFYTGNVEHEGNYDYITAGREHNTMLITSTDGFTFSKKRLVMQNSDYPENVTCHVRDPKVFKYNDKLYMVLGARRKDDVGEALLYTSSDFLEWKQINTFNSVEPFGFMWECPDIFSLDDKTFLSFSPQGVSADGSLYNNVCQSGYSVISNDIDNDGSVTNFTEYDRGFDFYAPQTFTDNIGRRIMLAWSGLPGIEDYYENPSKHLGWIHCLCMPRILTEKNGHIIQTPLPEFEKLRTDFSEHQCRSSLDITGYDTFEAEIENIKASKDVCISFSDDCKIEYSNNVLCLSFGKSGYGRTKRSVELSSLESIHIFCDCSIVEIFVNDGYEVFTSRFYPEFTSDVISMRGLDADIKLYRLNSFTITQDY